MTLDDREFVLQQVGRLLRNNHGNRITEELGSGLLASLERVLPTAAPEPTAPANQPQGQPG